MHYLRSVQVFACFWKMLNRYIEIVAFLRFIWKTFRCLLEATLPTQIYFNSCCPGIGSAHCSRHETPIDARVQLVSRNSNLLNDIQPLLSKGALSHGQGRPKSSRENSASVVCLG
jgi:hypothetical protein